MKIRFQSIIRKFGQQGEKTGWTYVELAQDIVEQINPGVRKSFRVKGLLDKHPISGVAILPMGGGNFILPLNAAMRKAIAKKEGAMLALELSIDKAVYTLNSLLVEALETSDKAHQIFYKLPRSHQNYYSKWVESAKMQATREKRVLQIVFALERGLTYAEMLREQAAQRKL